MPEEEEKTEVTREDIQNEIKDKINSHILEIKNHSDSVLSIVGKEDFQEEDLDRAFETADSIQEQYEEIIALLFEMRDRLHI